MNVHELMEQRDAQWAAALAGGTEKITALRKVYADAGWNVCPHPTCPPFDCRAENVPCESIDGLTCPCGNATHLDGFDPVVNDERVVTAGAEANDFDAMIYECVACGRRYDLASHDGTTVTVVRGPSLFCRWCGRGARLVVHPEHGKMARCEGDQHCPSDKSDEGRHSIIGVTWTDCANPTHDHDAITDPDGYSEPTTNLCNDENGPLHYDTTQGWYYHDDLDPAHACFLSGPNAENPCYTHGELAEDKARCQGEPWPERHSDTCLWCRNAMLTQARAKHDAGE